MPDVARPNFPINDMTGLLAMIQSAMYLCGMPDKAMDALFNAHRSVVEEIATAGGSMDAMQILIGNNADGAWDNDIALLAGGVKKAA